MKIFFFITIFSLCLGQSVSAKFFEKTDTELKVKMLFTGHYVDDKEVESRIFGTNFKVYLKQKMTESLDAIVSTSIILEVGSNNSLRVDEFAPNQGVFLNYSYLKWTPFEFSELRAGAINQAVLNSPLLLTSTAFLGSSQEIFWELYKDAKIFFRMQQAIPHNHNLSVRVGSVDEGTPNFFSETLGAHFLGDVASFKIEGSTFAFDKLSNAVAYKSQFLGNSVNGQTADTANLIYTFKGYNIYSHFEFRPLPTLGIFLEGQYLFNDKAPNGRNTGTLLKLGATFQKYSFYGETFKNQSDSSPAFYNNKFYGHNNKKGLAIGLEGELDKLLFNIRYAQLSVIDASIYQSDTKIIQFNISRTLF